MPFYCAECLHAVVGRSGHLCGPCVKSTGRKNNHSVYNDKHKKNRELAVAYAAENRKLVEATPLSRTLMFAFVNKASAVMNIEMDKKLKESQSSNIIIR